MSPKEIAQHYEAKIFDTAEAAEAAGFVLTETMTPRNTWNKASATFAIVSKLMERKRSGEASEIGIVLESSSVTGCYKRKDEG